MGDSLARQRRHQHIELIAANRPWIGNRDLALPDHIKVGALEGEGPWIAAHDPAQAGRHLFKRAILESHLAGKWRRLLILAAQCGLSLGGYRIRLNAFPAASSRKCLRSLQMLAPVTIPDKRIALSGMTGAEQCNRLRYDLPPKALAGRFVNVQTVFPLAVKGKLDHNVSGAFLSM